LKQAALVGPPTPAQGSQKKDLAGSLDSKSDNTIEIFSAKIKV
jgi:hypothetical protein